MMVESKKALIIFSRLPIGRETKTRLAPLLSEAQRAELHLAMWRDIFPELTKLTEIEIFLYWTGSGDIKDYTKFIPPSFKLARQTGGNLGEKMSNAMRDTMSHGYEQVAIIGSDIPTLKAENITRAFEILIGFDVAIGASADGGYWLIGMRRLVTQVFDLTSWGNASVLDSTIEILRASGLSYQLADTLQDMDTPDDVAEFMKQPSNKDSQVYKFLRSALR